MTRQRISLFQDGCDPADGNLDTILLKEKKQNFWQDLVEFYGILLGQHRFR